MRKILFFILLIITVSVSCTNNKPIKGWKIDSSKNTDIGYADKYDKLPKLTFETITENEFLSLAPKTYIQTIKPDQNKDFFYIQTDLNKHKFKKYKDYGGKESWSGNEFVGYYPDLKLFAITDNSTAENLGFGQLFLLDSVTDYQYNIISFGDGNVALPIPSLNNKYFVYYYNSVYEHKNCDIGVLKINGKSNPQNYLSEYASYRSNDFAIEQIIWKSDNCFYVKGYEEIYENDNWIKKYKYYKTDLNKNTSVQ